MADLDVLGFALASIPLCIFGLIGNTLVARVVQKAREMHTTTNYLLANLTLERALREWKLIYVAQFIIDVFEFGYKLPFIHIPAPKVSKNNRSSLTENLNGPPEI